jgi:hypothetical protein
MLTLLLVVLAGSPELEKARGECERDLEACARFEALEAEEEKATREANEKKARANQAAREAHLEQTRAKLRAEDEKEAQQVAALRKKCGRDFGRVQVGMKWTRVRECAGPFEIAFEDPKGTEYQAEGGRVRVERGRITHVRYR